MNTVTESMKALAEVNRKRGNKLNDDILLRATLEDVFTEGSPLVFISNWKKMTLRHFDLN